MFWKRGRQDAEYHTLKLFQSSLFKFDVYLLRVPANNLVPWHTDPAPEGYIHRRFNAHLKGRGWTYLGSMGNSSKTRTLKFDASEVEHAYLANRDVLILSIGWLVKR